jgi:anthranilate phosphoribosyltransferase
MKKLLEHLLQGRHLTEDEAADLLVLLTDDSVHQAMAGAVLSALRSKGETSTEVRGFAKGMRSLARRPKLPDGRPAVDIVGTGGDGSGSLNLSTGSALVAAACGQPVVKHGNRSVSSKSGSADVLQELGLRLPLDEEAAGECLQRTGFTFLFAPYYHPAMKALAPVRRALGVRTVFNLLGPLTNPAEPPFYLIGAFSIDAAQLIADALSGLAVERAFVVHGAPSWDEATPIGPFALFDVRNGVVSRTERDPQTYGLARCRPKDLAGGDATENADQMRATFEGEPGPHRDALALGAALALELTGVARTPDAALGTALDAINSGAASRLLERLTGFAPQDTAPAEQPGD